VRHRLPHKVFSRKPSDVPRSWKDHNLRIGRSRPTDIASRAMAGRSERWVSPGMAWFAELFQRHSNCRSARAIAWMLRRRAPRSSCGYCCFVAAGSAVWEGLLESAFSWSSRAASSSNVIWRSWAMIERNRETRYSFMSFTPSRMEGLGGFP
jgi:hypothetical protein